MTASTFTHLDELPSESFFDTMLRDGEPMTRRLMDPDERAALTQKMLMLSTIGFGLYGLILGALCQTMPDSSLGSLLPPIVVMPLALVLGFLLTIAVGLPSFYFYTQLAGLDAPFRLITAQAVRVHARTSVLLLGITPFYLAGALFDYTIDHELSYITIFIGFVVPFFCGFFGLASLYKTFRTLVTLLPLTHERRGNVVMRLVLCWGVFAAVIAPIAVWRIMMLLSEGL